MRARGFTLIELVVTIVLLSIVATISSQFIQNSASGLISSAGRNQLAESSYVINEKLNRAIKNALPNSIRLTSDSQCIEYIPIIAASVYTQLEINTDITSFDAYAFSSSTSVTGHVAVFPMPSDTYYSRVAPGPLTQTKALLPAGSTEVQVTLSSAHRFLDDSPTRRFYLFDQPETICQQGAFLYRYRGYGFINDVDNLKAALPDNINDGREVLAYPLELGSLSFRYLPASLRRNGLVAYDYIVAHPTTGESQQIAQQVRVLNVP